MKLTIRKMGINGEGIGYDNHIPVFVPQALIDEEVECQVTEDHGRYKKAELIRVLKPSKNRRPAVCPYQKECGGCPLMILDYEKQLEVKRDFLCESLRKYCPGTEDLIEEVIPSNKTVGYRNQCKLPVKQVSGRLASGIFRTGSSYLTGIKECCVHEKEIDTVRLNVIRILNENGYRDYHEKLKKGIRSVVVRHLAGKIQVALISGQTEITAEVINQVMALPRVVSFYQNINTAPRLVPLFGPVWKHLGGSRSLTVEIHGLKLKLSAASFFQLNTEQAFSLYQEAVSMIPDCKLMVEAYCGIGTMSLMAHEKAQNIIGIEIVGSAIGNANENARLNRIENVRFIAGDAAEELTKISKKSKIDVLLIDPPRTGIDEAMLDCIMRSKIRVILYVSCNPSTLGKNLNDLSNRYEVQRIVPFDLFPNTPLVETIVMLTRK